MHACTCSTKCHPTCEAACRDLVANGRATVVVAHPDFSSMSDARCTVTGTFATVSGQDDVAQAREAYLKRHPDSFWVDFGDFSFLRMDDVVEANYIGGFGRAAKVRFQLTLSAMAHFSHAPDML